MPMYDYECSECGDTLELKIPYDERHNARQHEPTEGGCGGVLKRVWLTPPTDGRAAYQMQGVMYNQRGQKVGHVPGHFGKLAKNKRRKT